MKRVTIHLAVCNTQVAAKAHIVSTILDEIQCTVYV